MVPASTSTRTRRLATPRLIATLGMFALSATFFCVIIGYLLVHRIDDRQEAERRVQLVEAIGDIRASGADISELDPQFLTGLERSLGLKDLRFEAELDAGAREFQPAIDGEGRILGWFTWERDSTITQALLRLWPLLLASSIGLIGFAGLALWQVRRAMRDLAASEQWAWQLAHEDPLTGLPNHRRMVDLIDVSLAARTPCEVVSLAVIDIDGLNEVNAVHGRHIGDALLADFGGRLAQAAPQSAGRIGDDEFALVLTTSNTLEAAEIFCNVAQALARPYWLAEQAVQIGVTLGFAHALRDGAGRDDLFRRADLTLRAAKRKNRGGILEFNPALDAEFSVRRFVERELRRSLDEKTLDVHYQPVVTADGARMIGVEALLRWKHPERGEIAPAVFVPVAEQSGLMGRLGEFVLRRALTDAKRWPTLSIAVNVSPVQMRDPLFVNLVLAVLAETRITPSRVVLEMTEGVLIENPEEAKRRLDALHAIGVQLALDDFGTGYSSLTYLRRYRFDMLKIDRGFVQALGLSHEGEAIIRAIVALARALNLKIQAEGIETEEQRVLLRLAGCEEMQGFLFAKPGPCETIDRLLVQANAPAAGSRRVKREAVAETRPRAADRTKSARHNAA